MAQHALITGSITGRIPHGDGVVNVTPDVILFDTVEEAEAVAASIELEQAVRGTHPIQDECTALSDPVLHPDVPEDVITAHRAAHAALTEKAGL